MNLQSLLEAINYANDNPKADPKIVAKFADIRPQDRSYYIMKWAEEKGIDGDDAMYMAGYVQDGYIGAGAWNWLYVGENIEEKAPSDAIYGIFADGKDVTARYSSLSDAKKAAEELQQKSPKVKYIVKKTDPENIEEGEERSIIADACVEKLVDEFGGRENQFANKEDFEYAIYQALEDLDVEDCVDPEMEVGGQPIGDFASGRVIDCCSSSDIIYDVMANMDETQIGEGTEGRWAIYIDGKDAQVRFKDYVDAGEMEDKMKKKYPSKEIELKKVGINEDEQKMIGTPDGYYDAEERTEAYNQLQDALAQSNRVEAEYVKDGHCPECPNVEDDEDCYGFGNYGCDDGELTYDGDTVSWKAIKDHDERQAQRQQPIYYFIFIYIIFITFIILNIFIKYKNIIHIIIS